MPEVQNIGAMDYGTIQPQQIQSQEQYPAIPVYEEAQMVPQKRGVSVPAAVVIAGLTALGGLWAGNKMGSKAAQGAIEELKMLKNSEAVKNYESLKKAAEDASREANDVIDKTFGGLLNGKKFAKNIKEKFKPFVGDVEKAAKEGEKAAEKAAEDGAKTSAEAKKPTHF